MRHVALLRAINVGGTAKLPMADLRELCAGLGWRGVVTYIQSGNVVFEADSAPAALEAALEEAVARRFGLARPVLVRTAEQWAAHAAGSPFPEAERDAPNRLMLCLAKAPLAAGAAAALQARAAHGEQVRQRGEAVWVLYPEGAGRSKLTPSLLDRAAGSPVTARNWRTVGMLQEMLIA